MGRFCTSGALSALTLVLAGAASGCLNRPIEPLEPRSTSTVTDRLSNSQVDKIDLLLVIDNSGSMADKQKVLADAVPDLVKRLVSPLCVDNAGQAIDPQPQPGEECPGGSVHEFEPIVDMHVGIVSSDLGSLGAEGCTTNDRGHLINRAAVPVAGYNGQSFLAWDPKGKLTPPGESVLENGDQGLIPSLEEMVKGVGQSGCGYEAPLESWYRFLADPTPPDLLEVREVDGEPQLVRGEIDQLLLAQRAAFLRPDSLLAIIMLTDENDCSLKEEVNAWKLLSVPSSTEHPSNLRCFDQVKQFGADLLQPLERYVQALKEVKIKDREGNLVPNPIFSDLDPTDGVPLSRDPSLVFMAGIVGVPWQDIARDRNDLTKGFRDAEELGESLPGGFTTWDLILGDPAAGIAPKDPLMIESIEPRAGTNPLTGESTVLPSVSGSHSVNGRERTISDAADLQYACIFPIPTPRDCQGNEPQCDCNEQKLTVSPDNPLCEPNPADGGELTLQARAKAYPGLRELGVLKGAEGQGIVASVCPKHLDLGENDVVPADYGYRPAIGAIVDRLKTALRPACLPRPLHPDEDDQVPCLIIEARNTQGAACECDPSQARQPVAPEHRPAVTEIVEDVYAEQAGWNCFCEVPQLLGEALDACQTDPGKAPQVNGAPVDGWCYVDEQTSPEGAEEIVQRCPDTEKRMLRFVGKGGVQNDGTLFITCSGE